VNSNAKGFRVIVSVRAQRFLCFAIVLALLLRSA
jgi:hypothetical protein